MASQPENASGLNRSYSEEMWRVYRFLDQSLDPRGLDDLYDFAAPFLDSSSQVLDAGCRDAKHLISLVQRFGVAGGVGIDPVEIHIDRAREAVAGAGLDGRIDVLVGIMEHLPFADAYFDFVWCRDVIEQVAALDAALQETRRVLKPGGRMLVYTVFRGGRLSSDEAEMMDRAFGDVPRNYVAANVESAFAAARFEIEQKDVIGSEFREHAEEQDAGASLWLLRLSRLRRRREALVEQFGNDVVDHVEARLHWVPFILLGKVVPTVYILRRADDI